MIVGDVSGKGIPASLMMAGLMVLQRFLVSPFSLASPGGLTALSRGGVKRLPILLNSFLSSSGSEDSFSTFVSVLIDPAGGVLTYSNAGHCSPFLIMDGGNLRELREGGLALGVMGDALYNEESLDIREGDLLVLYSDGVTDALNPARERYRPARLKAIMPSLYGLSAGDALRRLIESVEEFQEGTPQADDMTLVVVRIGKIPIPPVEEQRPGGVKNCICDSYGQLLKDRW